jgi:plasmid replication initiation protein
MAIVKSNKLIETSYTLGSREQFFVLFLISQISQKDTEFREYRINYKDISQLMNFDGRRRVANKEDVFKMMNNLNTQPIRFTEGEEDVQVVWITSLRYNKRTGEYTFTFGKELKPFLLQLKEHFTLYNISSVVHLSGHSTRIYEVLKRHHFKKEPVTLTVADLKFWLKIEKKYPEYYEFKRWVLEPSREELEKYTDIRFTYREAEKEGKKIISLEFNIFDNEPTEQPTSLNILTTLSERLALSAPLESDTSYKDIKTSLSSSRKQQLDALTLEQYKSFTFLSEKSINAGFILDTILAHPKVKYEPLRGFEDIYFQIMWHFFETKTKSKEKAGAFVNWFKNGRLTEDALHARFTEGTLEKRRLMQSSEIDRRLVSKTMNHLAFETLEGERTRETATSKTVEPIDMKIHIPNSIVTPFKESLNRIVQSKPTFKKGFDIAAFKAEYPNEYAQFFEKAGNDYLQFYSESGLNNAFDAEKHRESIEHRAKSYCEEWVKSKGA